MSVKKKNTPLPLSTPGGRLRAARLSLGLTGEVFGEGIGITKGSVSSWETDQRSPDGSSLVALRFVYNLNPDWILSGDPPMWMDPPPHRQATPFDEVFLDRPLIVGAATCGPGGEIEDPGPNASRYALRRDFAQRILHRCGGGQDEDLFFLLCRGESMRPTILDKEIVLLNAALAVRMQPKANGIYLVRRSPNDDEARVKRLRLDMAKGQLLLASDNRAFPPIVVDLDQVPLHQLILGRVVWVGRYLLDTDPPEGDW